MIPYQHTIALLIIGLVVAFSSGVYVSRTDHPPSAIPSNFDVGAAVAGEKAARVEASAYQALLTRALDSCKPTQDAH